MLHIATVHYGSPGWVEVQTRYLREHISIPHQTWASLEGIDSSYCSYFDHVVDQIGAHSDKLNHLAIEIAHEASPDDLLMFLDGDAFPVGDPMPLIADGLAKAPLIAVRRPENGGDPQPHPCFCVTTAKAWHELNGDWSRGYVWINDYGQRISDVGGNLLRQLELTSTPWVSVLRSNRKNLDPVFFGVYGGTIYHHGGGFRGAAALTRFHVSQEPSPRPVPSWPVARWAGRRSNWQTHEAWHRDTKERLSRLSEELFARIQRGDPGWLDELV